MAIKEVLAFDHLPALGLVTYAGVPGIFDKNRGFGTAVVKLILNRKRLTAYGGGCMLRLKLDQLNLDYSKKVIIGYRIRIDGTGCFVVGFSQTAVTASLPIPPITGLMLGISANTDAYVEVVLDYEHGVIIVFVDGVAKLTRELAGEGTSYPSLSWGNNVDNGVGFNLTDIYVRDCSGESDIFPSGGMICTPVTVDVVEDTNWAASNGDTLLGALNTPFTALSEATPTIDSPVSAVAQSVTIGLTATVEDNTVIEAVKLLISAKDTITPSKTVKGSLKLGSTTVNGNNLLLTTAMQPNKSLGCFSKAPDGTAWTIAKVNQATAIVAIE